MPGHVSYVIRLNVGEAPPFAMPQSLAPTHNRTLRLAALIYCHTHAHDFTITSL